MSAGRAPRTVWRRSGAEAVQAQRELDLKGAFRFLPVGAEQLADPFEPLRHRVHVDVQQFRRTGQAATHAEVGLKRFDQGGPAPYVVVDDRADGGAQERVDVAVTAVRCGAEQQPDEAQLGGARTGPAPARGGGGDYPPVPGA